MYNYSNCRELIDFLFSQYMENVGDCEFAKKHLSWQAIQKQDLSHLTLITTLDQCFTSNVNTVICIQNYWSKSFPIDLRKYPNSISTVYQNLETGNFYLVYRDFGGHVPELRCRLIQQNFLIKFEASEVI